MTENPAQMGFAEKESSFVVIKEGWLHRRFGLSLSLSLGVHKVPSKCLGSGTSPFLMFQTLVHMCVGDGWPGTRYSWLTGKSRSFAKPGAPSEQL